MERKDNNNNNKKKKELKKKKKPWIQDHKSLYNLGVLHFFVFVFFFFSSKVYLGENIPKNSLK